MKPRSLIFLTLVFVALAIVTVLQGQPRAIIPSESTVPDSVVQNPPIEADNTDVITPVAHATDVAQSTPNQIRPTTRFDTQSRLFGFVARDIVSLRIEDPYLGDSLTLNRLADGGWVVDENPAAITQNIANALAETTARLPYSATIENIPAEQFADFGLTVENTLLFIQVILQNREEHIVAVGALAPNKSGHYALIDEDPNIYVVPVEPIAFYFYYLQEPVPSSP